MFPENRELPNDNQAEFIILGCLMIEHAQTSELFDQLSQEDFFDIRHRAIYGAMQKLWEEGQQIVTVPVLDRLAMEGQIDAAGGRAYVSTIGDGVARKTQVDYYTRRVVERRLLRELIHISSTIQDLAVQAEQEGVESASVVDAAIEKYTGLRDRAKAINCGLPNFDAAVELMVQLREPAKTIVRTGLPSIDESVGGFRGGELVIVTAETGVGKTFLALQIARNACTAGRHVLYCSGEMLAAHLMGRVLSSDSGVAYNKIRRPELLSERDVYTLFEAANTQCKTCRILDGELTLVNIRSSARAMRKDLGCVVVDYDELVEVRGKDEWEQQRTLVRSLKSLAMETQIPLVMVSQLRKSPEAKDKRHPTLHNLYGSGAKSKHASIILFVDRPFVQDLKGEETAATVYILKSRDGRMGKVDCIFNVHTFRFEERSQ